MTFIAKYGQKQTEWAWIILGTSDKTIGTHGCTVTCIGMITDLTPKEVNELFIKHGVYAQGNLVIWNRINIAIPWVHFEEMGRKYTYDNAIALDAIKRHGFVLAEVGAAPIGFPKGKHWVVMIGDKKIYDPWDEEVKPTSTYNFTGLAILHSDGKSTESADPCKALKNEIDRLKSTMTADKSTFTKDLALKDEECKQKEEAYKLKLADELQEIVNNIRMEV